MFGIGGGEMIFIIFIALMLFGTDKLPEIARGLGKGMAQLRNATNEIKNEIRKGAEEHGLDQKSLTSGFTDEIDNVKQGFNKMVDKQTPESPLNMNDVTSDITSEINKAKEALDDITGSGSIKRS
ncbi:Sec-independent protein translocase subunit TatA/TatB [Flavobacterium pallidum]|uniref:Sec-independent protein translocase protein TatA n=1 Tax=Flavobacterium pallidum TaxID=2172098 RepID=A0A2S1SE47_9FLAO|nr:twin-arginine translocase TatA/TatE family subunit [Flavobacterium pallidum]AWI24670.1 Sec-independent protein translocase TatA [Flavobacterium pallidum]